MCNIKAPVFAIVSAVARTHAAAGFDQSMQLSAARQNRELAIAVESATDVRGTGIMVSSADRRCVHVVAKVHGALFVHFWSCHARYPPPRLTALMPAFCMAAAAFAERIPARQYTSTWRDD